MSKIHEQKKTNPLFSHSCKSNMIKRNSFSSKHNQVITVRRVIGNAVIISSKFYIIIINFILKTNSSICYSIIFCLLIHRCTRKMGSFKELKKTGGPWGFPVLLIFYILTNAIQRTTARDEPTTTDTTATADRRSRNSSLCANMLYLA